MDIKFVWNLPYRPDMNGIEFVWALAKRRYKAEVDRHKALDRPWDQAGLVRSIMEGLSDEDVKKQAIRGQNAIANARPIEPLESELV